MSSVEFYFDRGIFLLPSRLALDVTRRQPCGFVSHAHMDHVGKHETSFCTQPTAAFLKHRIGNSKIQLLQLNSPVTFADLELTALNAGHIFGSAMLYAENDQGTLLYTGDFQLKNSLTAGQAELRPADCLITECTYGQTKYRFPQRKLVIEQLLEKINSAFKKGATPIIQAYVLGKAQEVTKIMTSAGFGVQQHPYVYEISQIYEQQGCDLGKFSLYPGHPLPNHVVIVPPKSQRSVPISGILHKETFSVTGWSLGGLPQKKHLADHLVPLSDHADFDELIETAERVNPKTVYCTHGSPSFVEELKQRGFNAHWLG